MIEPKDDLRHSPENDDPNWSESYYFSFRDISNEVSGFFRMGLRENAKDTNVWACLYHAGKVIYQKFKFNLPYTADGLDDIAIDGVHFFTTEALRAYGMAFRDRFVDVDLRWEALGDVVDIARLQGHISDALARGHHEQMGRVRGSVRLDKKIIDVEGIGFRDHSWGVRNWEAIKNWVACAGLINEDFCFHAARINEIGGRSSCLGFLSRNGSCRGVDDVKFFIDDLWYPKKGLVSLYFAGGEKVDVDIAFYPKQFAQIPMEFSLVSEYYVGLQSGAVKGTGFLEINRSLFFED